jgi:hypothetical protein
VAAGTVAPEHSEVGIVVPVTPVATSGQPDLGRRRRAVARVAVELLVHAEEREIRLTGMLEPPEGPPVRVVAEGTGRPQTAQVDVVVRVAGYALDARVPVPRCGVALLAGGHGVEPEQRKPGQIVLEEHLGHPSLLVVTLATASALLPLVYVVVVVTCTAGRVELLHPQRPGMASLALDVLVTASQRELGHPRMVEALGVPASLAMTTLTVRAVPPPVLVVCEVT